MHTIKKVPVGLPINLGYLTNVGRVIEIRGDRFRTCNGWFNTFEYKPIFLMVDNIVLSPHFDYLLHVAEAEFEFDTIIIPFMKDAKIAILPKSKRQHMALFEQINQIEI